MFNDKKILYIISSSSLISLLLALFMPGEYSGRILAAVFLLPIAVLMLVFVKKRGLLSINKKEVTLLVGVIGVIYTVLYYLSGLRFGFYQNHYLLDLRYIIPIAVIILSTEVIRLVVRAQEDRKADVICYVSCVIADALTVGNIHYVDTFDRFMRFVALTVFPSLLANLLYHYLSKRYGMYPNVIFRALTALLVYFVPVTPALPDALLAFVRLLLPILIYYVIDSLYEKKRRYAIIKKSKLSPVITAVAVIILTGFVMLISNQFKYGALVIATESMTGELNKGDVSIFESYDGQPIEKGQVIVFEKDGSTIVHRVVDIKRINGQNQYFTKGDANDGNDSGYITKSQIKGIVDMNDIESALAALAKEGVDAIYIPTDNVLANASALVHSANMGE